MAVHENSVAPTRAARAETPPADHWQRWASPDAVAATSAAPAPLPSNVVPLATAASAAVATPPPLTVAPAPSLPVDTAPPLGSEAPYRVLIVEDDRSQALFAQSVLHGAGMEAIVISDAEGAQQAIA